MEKKTPIQQAIAKITEQKAEVQKEYLEAQRDGNLIGETMAATENMTISIVLTTLQSLLQDEQKMVEEAFKAANERAGVWPNDWPKYPTFADYNTTYNSTK